MKKNRILSLFVVVLLALTCWTTAGLAESEAIDTSEELVITGYLLGDPPVGLPDVLDAVNAKLKKDINATLNLKYIGWGEMASKYAAILAAGMDVDFIYTAPWCYYSQQAPKGAFLEINLDDVQKYMPLHAAAVPQVGWDQCKINGKIYMLPTSTPDQKCSVAIVRGDLLKKYNLETPTKLSDLTPYFEAVKQNEDGMIPINMDKQYDLAAVAPALINEMVSPNVDVLFTTGSGSAIIYDYSVDKPMLVSEFEEPFASGFVAGYEKMKEWYDAGYVNTDVFGNATRSLDTFLQGRSSIAVGNSIDTQSVIASAQEYGWEPVIVPFLFKDGKAMRDAYSVNGVAIAATCKHPERTMMALDLMMEDPDYARLLYYGIDGVNYVETADGRLGLPEGVTNETNTYTGESAGFWFITKSIVLPSASWPDSYIDFVNNTLPAVLINNPLAAFVPDTANIKTEVANVSSALTQYNSQLNAGSIADVGEAWATLKEKVEVAGQQTILDELTKQLDAYYTSLGK